MMRPARALLSPGFRTAPVRTWRASVGTAVSVALGDPALWAFGALGFCARGGVLLLAMPIVTVPSPVTVAVLLRDHITTAGTGPAFTALLVLLLVAFGLCVLGGLLLAALADVAAFEQFMHAGETEEARSSRVARGLTRRGRSRLVLWLAGVQAVVLLPAGLALALVAGQIEPLVRSEILSPSSFEVPLFLRIAFGLRESLVLLVGGLVVADLLYALVSRRLLANTVGLLPEDGVPPRRSIVRVALDGAGRLVRRPGRTLVTFLVAWATTVTVVVPVAWGLFVAWGAVRGLYLTPFSARGPEAIVGAIAVTVILAAIWIASVILAGFASAVRAALWSTAALD